MKYMKEDAVSLMYEPKYGIANEDYDNLYKIIEYINQKVIFTHENGLEGNKERLDKISIYTSVHNNNIKLELGNDVRANEVDYTYIFGCQKDNLYYLIGYFKNRDYDNNLIKNEITFDYGSLKDFIYDRVYNYLNELEKEDEWQGEFEYQKEFGEMEEFE